jgi:hypothetical protein
MYHHININNCTIWIGFKMAAEVWEEVATALSVIVSTTDKSGNMKKELKITIAETVSNIRKLLS